MDILQQTFPQDQIGTVSMSKQMDILRFHCGHIVSRFFNMNIFWYIYCVVESSWLFVLRSEHDNLQIYSCCKILYLKGRIQVVWASRTKSKLLLYYLLLGKRFVKGLLTEKKIKSWIHNMPWWPLFVQAQSFYFSDNCHFAFANQIRTFFFIF